MQEKTWSSYEWIDKWGQSVSTTFGKKSLGLNLNSEHHLLNIPMAHCLQQQQHIEKNIIPSFILNVFGVLIKILSMAKIIKKW